MDITSKRAEILASLHKIFCDAMEPPANGIGRPDYKTALQALAQEWDVVRYCTDREDKRAALNGDAGSNILGDPESRLRAISALQDAIADLSTR